MTALTWFLVVQGTLGGRSMGVVRLPYLESCRHLQALGLLGEGDPPPMANRLPRYDDDEPLGVSFFRMLVKDSDLSNLTLPRSYFGRSEISRVSFRNTDLTESGMSWNDFIEVDFGSAVLTGSDLSASVFDRVDFTGADLRGAQMRRSDFLSCRFDEAILDAAVFARRQALKLAISPSQALVIDWRDDDGPEPDGG